MEITPNRSYANNYQEPNVSSDNIGNLVEQIKGIAGSLEIHGRILANALAGTQPEGPEVPVGKLSHVALLDQLKAIRTIMFDAEAQFSRARNAVGV